MVYLKNGSIIRGTIIEQIPNESVRIETADKSVFVYRMNEISKIAKETKLTTYTPSNKKESGSSKSKDNASTSAASTSTASASKGEKKSGYYGSIRAGGGIGLGNSQDVAILKLDIINGYRFNQYFAAGIGIGGQDYFSTDLSNHSYCGSIFANFMGRYPDTKIAPYLGVGCGYTFQITPSFGGLGFLLNPTVGVSFRLGKSTIELGVGYLMQNVSVGNASATTNFILAELATTF
ncbi:MAG: hypothetical protein WCK84_11835 [Bacteroidota bacterium]